MEMIKKNYYFKVNQSKFDNRDKLYNQINIVLNRVVKTNNLKPIKVNKDFGYIKDDFVKGQFRLRLQIIEENNPQ